jgi:SAM-dependent methyltransferase
MATGYSDDLAYIHDSGFGDFARLSAPGLIDRLHRAKLNGGLVVDLGCGTGIWAEALVHAGYRVAGVDISEPMLALARRRVPQGKFVRDSLLQWPIPSCDAVTSMGECFNYLFSPENNINALGGVFRRVYSALRPGGLFQFDVAEPSRSPAVPTQKCFTGEDWAIFVETVEDHDQKLLTRRMTIFRKMGDLYRRSEEVHRLRLYTREEIGEQLTQAGFKHRVANGYGYFRFRSSHVAFLARKP